MRTLLPIVATLLIVAGCGGASSTAPDPEEDAGESVALFDGETLNGWHNPYEWGEAWVEDGEIRLKADRKFFLVTDEQYSDFELEASVMLPDTASNSGIMFRAHVEPNRVFGYQAEVDPTLRAWSGGLYDEDRRQWLNPVRGDSASVAAFRAAAGDAYRQGDWNHYHIRAVGDSLQIVLNGVLTTAYRDTMDEIGYVGIQHHGEAGKVYRFKDIRLRAVAAN